MENEFLLSCDLIKKCHLNYQITFINFDGYLWFTYILTRDTEKLIIVVGPFKTPAFRASWDYFTYRFEKQKSFFESCNQKLQSVVKIGIQYGNKKASMQIEIGFHEINVLHLIIFSIYTYVKQTHNLAVLIWYNNRFTIPIICYISKAIFKLPFYRVWLWSYQTKF